MSKTKNQNFNHLKIHSQYSICEGAIKIDDLAEYCKNNKIKSCCTHKKKDKKYIIYSISGINYYSDNIDKCLQQMELISDDIIKIFPDSSTTKRTKKHEYDKSGKSLIHQYIFLSLELL